MPEARQTGTFEAITLGIGHFLSPLEQELEDAGRARVLLAQLGLQLPASADGVPAFSSSITETVNSAKQLPDLISKLVSATDSNNTPGIFSASKDLAQCIVNVIKGIDGISSSINTLDGATGIPAPVLNDFASKLPRRLLDFLIIRNLEAIPIIPQILEFTHAIESPLRNSGSSDPKAPEFTEYQFFLDRLTGFIQSPGESLKTLYDWGNPGFDGNTLLTTLQILAGRVGIPAIVDTSVTPNVLDVVTAEISPKTDINPKGIIIKLIEKIQVDRAIPFNQGGDWQAEALLSNDLEAATSITLQPDENVTFQPPSATANGDYGIRFTAGRADGTPFIIFGQPQASRMEVKKFILEAKSKLNFGSSGAATAPFIIDGEIKGGKLVIDTSGGDGFISKILSGIRVENEFELGMGYSASQGLFFHGSSVMEIRLNVHVSLGLVDIDGLYLSFGIKDKSFPIGLATDLKSSLGPLTVVVENVGVQALISVPDDRKGNVGPLSFEIGFKPPKGVGLTIDAGIVNGGGYLYFDPDKEEYAGVLELSIVEIVTVKAIGLITTRMPDGSKGFSLLLIITAEFGTGIQLGFGFTLLGVGGLLGLNRTMLLEPLASGIRTGAINSVMFPPDPVANAPRIISDLRTYFPPYEGIFLIGPMVKIGWGTPTLISIAFGLIIEIPGNVAIVGVLRINLPDEDIPIVTINVAFLGALEFDKSRIWFFASMFDSRILFMTMEGDMGLLMDFSSNPNFVLSVGGFHPQFNPPPLPFPNPRRIHIDILRTPVARITAENYFAITSNTVQFGCSSDFFYGIDAFNLHGSFSFDALFQFSPFHFVIDISFTLGMDLFGVGVFSVRLKLSLSGPAPWNAKGTATLSIDLWLFSIDISVNFDITWGDADNPKLPPVKGIDILVAECDKADNWKAAIPANTRLLVNLRKLDVDAEKLVLHPIGTLRISQRALPLGINVDKVGANPVDDAHQFSLEIATSGLGITPNAPTEKFAIAQFQEMSDADKLSRPSFQDVDSGVELQFNGKQLGASKVTKRVVRYEVKINDIEGKHGAFRWFANISTLFYHWLDSAAVSRSSLSFAQRKAMVPTTKDERIQVGQPGYVIAGTSNNKPLAGAPSFASEAHAHDYLNEQLLKKPGMADEIHVIPSFEATTV
jgi:hypothetical protein